MAGVDGRFGRHRVFSELQTYATFYEALADSVWTFGAAGTTAIYNFDSRFYSSIQGTLESICQVLRRGRINDAYALLRKYYDGAIINIYSDLFIKTRLSIENLIVTEVDAWLRGDVPLPTYGAMRRFIASSDEAMPLTRLLTRDERYKSIRDRCNDHMHYNFFSNALLNDNQVDLSSRLGYLDEFAADARDVFVLHVAYVFFVNGHYMSSTDYVDALEVGASPEPGSQYWVAPFVQDVFDDIISEHRPEVGAVVKSNTFMSLG